MIVGKILHNIKIAHYCNILSHIRVNGSFKVYWSMNFHGINGDIINIFKNLHLGYYPSPLFFNPCNHIDVRGGGGVIP